MKSSKNSSKKSKTRKTKSNSPEKQDTPQTAKIILPENEIKIQKPTKKNQENNITSLIPGYEEKNERELKALRDLCELSEESDNLSVESQFQKMWMDYTKAKSKELLNPRREYDSNYNSVTSMEDKSKKGIVTNNNSHNNSGIRVVSRSETAQTLPTRNFLKENMSIKMKKDTTKRRLLGKAELDKLLSDRNAEISNSLRELKEKSQDKQGKGASDMANRMKMAERYPVVKYNSNSKEPLREEKSIQQRQQDSFREHNNNKLEDNNAFLLKGLDIRTINLIQAVRPTSSMKTNEKIKPNSSRILRHEIVELIEKYERSNSVVTADSNAKIKHRLKRYADDSPYDRTNNVFNNSDAVVKNDAENRILTMREAYDPPVGEKNKHKDFVPLKKVTKSELHSHASLEETEKTAHLTLQSEENKIKFQSRTVYKWSGEGNFNKVPISSRNSGRDGSTGKIRSNERETVSYKGTPNFKKVEKYSFVTRDCSSLPQSLILDQIDSSRDIQHTKAPVQDIMISSSQNPLNRDRPTTSGLESPQRKNIMKILNYFRNCGEGRKINDDPGNSVLRKLLQSSHNRRDRNETRSISRMGESEMGGKLLDSFRATSGENRYQRPMSKRNSLVSMKAAPLSTIMKSFRESAITTLQRAPTSTFLQAVGKKFH